MASPLTIDTSAKPVFKTSLSMPQLEALRAQVDLIDPDDSQIEQYQQVNEIVNKMKGKFENDYDQMEISQVIGVLDGVLKGKRGSKPYELINVISKVLGRVTDVSTSGGRRRTRRKRRTQRQRKVRSM